MNTRAIWSAALVSVVLTLWVFAPVSGFDFAAYDDEEYIVDNPAVAAGLTAEGTRWAFENAYRGTGGPLTWLSHMADVEMFGLDAGAHHVTSLVIHVLASILCGLSLWMLTDAVWRSFIVAALFAVHPLHVESVAWVAERKDVISAVFWFLTVIAYVQYVRRPTPARYLAVCGVFVLGLLSKPMVATLPAVLLLVDAWPLGRTDGWRRLVVEKIPLAAFAAIAMYATLGAQQARGAVTLGDALPFGARLSNAVVSYATYLRKTIWPADLIPFYPFRVDLPILAVVTSAAVLIGLTATAFVLRRRLPAVWMGWLWYAGTLVPVSGVVQVGGHAMADRFTYLPLVGIFIAVVWLVTDQAKRLSVPAASLCATAVIVVAAFGVAARAQVLHWRDGYTLWTHTVRVDPTNARGYSNLGAVLARRGQRDDAIRAFREALRLHPDVPQTHYNLGLALADRGDATQAEVEFREAIRLDPNYAGPRTALATILVESGRLGDALPHLREAVRLRADDVLVHVNLGVTLGQLQRQAEAIPHIREAIRRDPLNGRWHYFLAMMQLELGQLGPAKVSMREAVRLAPGDAMARRALEIMEGR
jgi:Flp pilus assembly protein TadD